MAASKNQMAKMAMKIGGETAAKEIMKIIEASNQNPWHEMANKIIARMARQRCGSIVARAAAHFMRAAQAPLRASRITRKIALRSKTALLYSAWPLP
jgi:ethanolamine ammonia-lyase small subunit